LSFKWGGVYSIVLGWLRCYQGCALPIQGACSSIGASNGPSYSGILFVSVSLKFLLFLMAFIVVQHALSCAWGYVVGKGRTFCPGKFFNPAHSLSAYKFNTDSL